MRRKLLLGLVVALPFPFLSALGADAIQPGQLLADPPTPAAVGLVLPIVGGDDDRDARTTVRFRAQGTLEWRDALPLLRVRPDQIGDESPPEAFGLPRPTPQFAGSVLGLVPNSTYEVQVTLTDPDGGGGTFNLLATTAALPATDPAVPTPVAVSTAAALNTALAGADPGDVIWLAAGAYVGSFTINRDGTAANPIVIRGAGRDLTTIDASGRSIGLVINGDHVHVEQLTVRGSDWGARVYNTTGVAIRDTRITDVAQGIDGRTGSTRNLFLCDNILEGRRVWPDFTNNIQDVEGIVVTGQGHTLCHNRISGFGDALGLNQNTNLVNAAIDIFGNDVLWTGDDGIELDYGHRNIRVWRNRITNAQMGVSFQPVWGGPAYVVRNVLVNIARSPYKLNNDPTGFYIINNTSMRTLGIGNNGAYALPSLGYTQADGDPAYAANFQFRNNLLVGVSAPAFVTTELFDAQIDSNGWYPDGTFVFFQSWANLADLISNSPFETNGRLIEPQPFVGPIVLGANHLTQMAPQSPLPSALSAVIDGGQVLPNVNDEFAGGAPDLGAWERGLPLPVYGPRPFTDSDGDGVPDDTDNCVQVPNADQRDTSDDGYGNFCDADFNGNGIVDSADGALLRVRFGSTLHPDQDLNGNGVVDSNDGARLRARFGQAPGPSGLRP